MSSTYAEPVVADPPLRRTRRRRTVPAAAGTPVTAPVRTARPPAGADAGS